MEELDQILDRMKKAGFDRRIIEAVREIKRENFVPEYLKTQAYVDAPLPIGYGATISQPYTVGFMLNELNLKKGDKVLEIGTGSGWNAVLIAYLVGKKGKVYTIERIKELIEEIKKKKRFAPYKNIEIFHMDGSRGLEEYAPYDKIIITAAAEKLDNEILYQLKNKGVLIAPVKKKGEDYQIMTKITRKGAKFITEEKGYFTFVPLIKD